ncbi:hypothetical protein IQ62_06640 [Streptomyces scabiei]|nr:hypothetical protein IQ62_06640 [Streptomyces scabiei]
MQFSWNVKEPHEQATFPDPFQRRVGDHGGRSVPLSVPQRPRQRFARDVRVLATHGAIRSGPLAELSGRQLLGLEPFPMVAGGVPQVG